MSDSYIPLAEQLVFARPTTEAVAQEVLEWVAAREGKTLQRLADELRRVGDDSPWVGGDFGAESA